MLLSDHFCQRGNLLEEAVLEMGFEDLGRFPGRGGCKQGPRSQNNMECLGGKSHAAL